MGAAAWAFWIGGGLLAVAGASLLLRALFADRSRGRQRCPRCWYDLTGIAHGSPERKLGESAPAPAPPDLTASSPPICPECGRTARSHRSLRRTRRHWSKAGLALLVVAGGALLASLPRVAREGWASIIPTPVLPYAVLLLSDEAAAEYKRLSPKLRYPPRDLSRRQRILIAAHLRNSITAQLEGRPSATAFNGMYSDFTLLAYLGHDGALAASITRRVLREAGLGSGDRVWAVQAIIAIDRPHRAMAALAVAATDDPDNNVRFAAAGVIVTDLLREPAAPQVLTTLLADRDPPIRARAAAALGRCGPRAAAALPSLRNLAATDPDPTTRITASTAASQIEEALKTTFGS